MPHNKLIREKPTPTPQHRKLEMYVCVYPEEDDDTLSLSSLHSYSNTKTMHISRLMAAAFILVPILPPLWQTTALTAVVAPSGSS